VPDVPAVPLYESNVLLIFIKASSRESIGSTSILDKYSPLYNTHREFSYVAQVGHIAAVLIICKFIYF
jgi:hypothetical protein